MKILDITNLFPDQKFHTSGISHKELEEVLREASAIEYPLDPVNDINYTENGVTIVLQSGEVIEVEIDWDEFILG